jgi:hypothetical protein
MNFDSLDMAKRTLKELSTAVIDSKKAASKGDDAIHIDKSVYDDLLNNNLMFALTNNSPEFVELYLDYGASVSSLKPTHPELTTKHKKDIAKLDGRKTKGKKLQLQTYMPKLPPVALAVEELYQSAGQSSHSHVCQLVQNSKYQSGTVSNIEDFTLGKTRLYNVIHMERLMQDLVGGSFNMERDWSIFDEKAKNEKANKEDPENILACEMMAYHLLMVRGEKEPEESPRHCQKRKHEHYFHAFSSG